MTTIADVIERTYRDYLLPPSEQPTRFKVDTGGIDDSSDTLPVDVGLLSPEEQDLVGVATLLEVESEWLLITGVTGDPPSSLTVDRGMFGTTPAAHAAGKYVYLSASFPRPVLFDAVADAVEELWPDLWAIATEEVWSDSTSPVELPSVCKEVTHVRAQIGGRWTPVGNWDFLNHFPPSSTNKALQLLDIGDGVPMHVIYKASTVRPTAEADVLSDLNVDDGWVKVIEVGAVAAALAHEDIDRVNIEFITQALEAQDVSVGKGADVRDSLLQYRNYLLRPLRDSLEAQMQHDDVVVHSMF